jgi:hypothetical protein
MVSNLEQQVSGKHVAVDRSRSSCSLSLLAEHPKHMTCSPWDTNVDGSLVGLATGSPGCLALSAAVILNYHITHDAQAAPQLWKVEQQEHEFTSHIVRPNFR